MVKYITLLFLFVVSFSIGSLKSVSERAITTKLEVRREEINKREKEIEIKKEKIAKLAAERNYAAAHEEGEALEQLLDTHITALRKFSIDFPSERKEANIKEGKAELDKAMIQQRIVNLAQEIKQEGIEIVYTPSEADVSFNILMEGLKNDKTVSSGWKDRLERFYNEFKLKVYELPILGNPKKAIEIREKLHSIYESSDKIKEQIVNLKEWGDRVINAESIGRSADEVQQQLVAIGRYVNRLENINRRINQNQPGALNEKLKLQQKALPEIVLRTATNLVQFSEKLNAIKKELLEKNVMRGALDTTLQDIQETVTDLLNQKINVQDYYTQESLEEQPHPGSELVTIYDV